MPQVHKILIGGYKFSMGEVQNNLFKNENETIASKCDCIQNVRICLNLKIRDGLIYHI